MKIRSSALFIAAAILFSLRLVAQQTTGSGTVRFLDRPFGSNDLIYCDSLHIDMTDVSSPKPGMRYYAWLLEDDDTTYVSLGGLTVTGGSISFGARNTTGNFVSLCKAAVISEEADPYAGTAPTQGSVVFRGSLYDGPGSPGASNALTYIRNVIGTFTTPSSLGLLSWMVRQMIKPDNMVQHAGFAEAAGTVANVKLHTDHAFDFVNGQLSGLTGAGSIASNGDPLGYRLQRYGDLDTLYTSAGGAGRHIALAFQQSDATPAMTSEGNNALTALRNILGMDNVTGWSKEMRDKCLQILTTSYANATAARTDATLMRQIASRIQHGSAGTGNTDPATGGIMVAWWRAQAMATITMTPLLYPPDAPVLKTPVDGAVDVSIHSFLTWQHDAVADSYDVQVSLSESFQQDSTISMATADTMLHVGPLPQAVLQYWRVRGINNAGTGTWSAPWSFTTETLPPSAIAMIAPADGAVLSSDSVLFAWNAAEGIVTGYWFELSQDSAFGTSFLDTTLSATDTTTIVLGLTPSTNYVWRIRAKNESGWGSFSDIRSFTTKVSTAADDTELPVDFALSQNFPNPFNPSTHLVIDLPSESTVRITVHDLTGKTVATLFEGLQPAGRRIVVWDATSHATGGYLFRVQITDTRGQSRVEYRRGVLLK